MQAPPHRGASHRSEDMTHYDIHGAGEQMAKIKDFEHLIGTNYPP